MLKKEKIKYTLAISALITLVVGIAYIMVRTIIYVSFIGSWYESLLGFALLASESFILLHGVGYSIHILRVAWHTDKKFTPSFSGYLPPVAVVVSAYKEPLDVVEKTLISFYNLTYPNKHLYLLDDTRYDNLTPENKDKMIKYRKDVDNLAKRIGVNLFRRKWHDAKAGMLNDFLDFTAGRDRPDFEFTGKSPKEKRPVDFKYLVIFDADQTPFPKFLENMVAQMEEEPELAFIQTPQYYTNFLQNRVARAAGLQQAVFYEFICEGKSIKDAMFCCGTNVIFRREALEDIGGIEENSVTEDFATSLKIHSKGWRSAYSNKTMAFGLGPEDLGGYLKQQFRWALGTIGMLRVLIFKFFSNPKALSPVKWWEYMLSSTYYFIGWVFFTLVMCPILYLLLDIPSYFAYPKLFMLFFLPYFTVTLLVFFYTLKNRNYHVKDLILGQLLIAAAFPVYMKASIFGVLNVKSNFVVTPKGSSNSLPLTSLWMQLGLAIFNWIAIIWGIHRLIYEQNVALWGITLNIMWCAYHFMMLLSVIYLNNPEAKLREKHI